MGRGTRTSPKGPAKKEPQSDVLEAAKAGWSTTLRYALLLLAARPAATTASVGSIAAAVYLRVRGLIP